MNKFCENWGQQTVRLNQPIKCKREEEDVSRDSSCCECRQEERQNDVKRDGTTRFLGPGCPRCCPGLAAWLVSGRGGDGGPVGAVCGANSVVRAPEKVRKKVCVCMNFSQKRRNAESDGVQLDRWRRYLGEPMLVVRETNERTALKK